MPIDIGKLKEMASRRAAAREHTVMVVDDEPLITESMAMMLEDEYEVIQADCGETALNLLLDGDVAQRVSLIVSDQRMPGMSGVDFLREVASRFPAITRMMVSGHMDFQDLVGAINESHVHFFMAKPVHYDDLRATIQRGIELYERGMAPYRRIQELEQRRP